MSEHNLPRVGTLIRVISQGEIRYDGRFSRVDAVEGTVILYNVRSFGTEDRKAKVPIPPQDKIYEYISFRDTDIKSIRIMENIPSDPIKIGNVTPQHPPNAQPKPLLGNLKAYQLPELNAIDIGTSGAPGDDQQQQTAGAEQQDISSQVYQQESECQQNQKLNLLASCGNIPTTNNNPHVINSRAKEFIWTNMMKYGGIVGAVDMRNHGCDEHGRMRYVNYGPKCVQAGNPDMDQSKLEKDFDFEQGIQEFEQLRSKMMECKIDNEPESQQIDQTASAAGETVESGSGEQEPQSHEVIKSYDKNISFFDNLSRPTEKGGIKKKGNYRLEALKRNTETFGEVANSRVSYIRPGTGQFRKYNTDIKMNGGTVGEERKMRHNYMRPDSKYFPNGRNIHVTDDRIKMNGEEPNNHASFIRPGSKYFRKDENGHNKSVDHIKMNGGETKGRGRYISDGCKYLRKDDTVHNKSVEHIKMNGEEPKRRANYIRPDSKYFRKDQDGHNKSDGYINKNRETFGEVRKDRVNNIRPDSKYFRKDQDGQNKSDGYIKKNCETFGEVRKDRVNNNRHTIKTNRATFGKAPNRRVNSVRP